MRNDKRVDILLALFGDSQEGGIRNLSDDEKEFILDNHGLKVEIFVNLKNFADRLTQKNKSWLNNLNNPAELNTLFYGREIKRFLESPLLLKYRHRVRVGVEEIDLMELKDGELYDLSNERFGYFIHRVNGDSTAFFSLFRTWSAEKNKDTSVRVRLSQEQLNKILEIIKDGEEEGLNNFSLGDK